MEMVGELTKMQAQYPVKEGNDKASLRDKLPRNPNHHRAILGLSSAFWDAYLRNDAVARSWLNGGSPRDILEKQDRWQKK